MRGTLLLLLLLAAPAVARAQFLETQFVRGDCNCDGQVNVADSQCVSEHIFGQGSTCCRDACDVDDSGCLKVTDIVYINSYLFLGGEPPEAPWPLCGVDARWDCNGPRTGACSEFCSGCLLCGNPGCSTCELPHTACWCDLGCNAETYCP